MSNIKQLITALYTSIGNKRYMSTIEKMLNERLTDLNPEEQQAIRYLCADLENLKRSAQDAKRHKFF